MKTLPLASAALLTLALAMPAAAAPEFNVDVEPVGDNGSRVWLSYLADSDVTALDFTVTLDGPEDMRADTSRCLVSLPKSHTGLCQLEGNRLRGVIYSTSNTPLPDTSLGSVLIDPDSLLKSAGAKLGDGIRSVAVNPVTASGTSVNADVRVSGQSAQSSQGGGE